MQARRPGAASPAAASQPMQRPQNEARPSHLLQVQVLEQRAPSPAAAPQKQTKEPAGKAQPTRTCSRSRSLSSASRWPRWSFSSITWPTLPRTACRVVEGHGRGQPRAAAEGQHVQPAPPLTKRTPKPNTHWCAPPPTPTPEPPLALGMWSTYCGLMIALTLSSSTCGGEATQRGRPGKAPVRRAQEEVTTAASCWAPDAWRPLRLQASKVGQPKVCIPEGPRAPAGSSFAARCPGSKSGSRSSRAAPATGRVGDRARGC